jgi:hypothetical protein
MNQPKIFLSQLPDGGLCVYSGGLFGGSVQAKPNPAILKLSKQNLARRERGIALLQKITNRKPKLENKLCSRNH